MFVGGGGLFYFLQTGREEFSLLFFSPSLLHWEGFLARGTHVVAKYGRIFSGFVVKLIPAC